MATCADLESLLAAVEAERPDVVLTDIRMPPGGGDEGILLRSCADARPGPPLSVASPRWRVLVMAVPFGAREKLPSGSRIEEAVCRYSELSADGGGQARRERFS